MNSSTKLLILIFFIRTVCSAQSSDYYNLKDVRTYRFDHLEINTEKDAEYFIKHTAEFNFIDALKINYPFKLKELISGTGICSYIKELDLSDYTGEYDASAFDSCRGIEILHLSVKEEKLEQIKLTEKIKGLQVLYLYIIGKPEDLKPLSGLPKLKELHLIGDFLPLQLGEMIAQIKNQTQLQVLGLSIDRITDLPGNIIAMKNISKLNLYDNLSVYLNKGIYDLSEEKQSIIFNIYTDNINAVAISYYSINGKMEEFETDFLKNLYKGELMPQQFETENPDDVSKGSLIPFKKEFSPDFPNSPEFNRPYHKIIPAAEHFTINPNVNSVIYSVSGMKLTIAANSFVNSSGIQVSDPVHIKLIQISNSADILFAGLNLKNAGMYLSNRYLFNIQATSEKSSAMLKEGYQIRVNIPVSADSSKTYFYDYESGTWQDLNFYNQIFTNEFVPLDFYKIENTEASLAYFQFDTCTFNERFNNRHNYLLNDKNNNSQMLFKTGTYYSDLDRTWVKEFNKDGKFKGIKVKKGKAYVKIQKVIPKTRNKERQYFKLIDKTEQKLIHELSALKSINFNVPYNPENKKEFTDDYVRNSKYQDVRVHYSRGKDYCEITLKSNEGFKILKAFITDSEDKKVIKKQMDKFYKAYKKYERIKAKRELEFNNLNSARYAEFRSFSNEKLLALQKENKSSELKIHQLGTFGLMYEQYPVFSTNIIAQYTDENGLPIDVKDLFLIDTRYNTVFRIEVGNISFDPSTTYLIVATDYTGNLYYANKSDISASNLSDNSLTYIKLKKVKQDISSVQMFIQQIRN